MPKTASPVDLIAHAAKKFPHVRRGTSISLADGRAAVVAVNCERLHVGCVIGRAARGEPFVRRRLNGYLPGNAANVSRLRDGHEQATVHAGSKTPVADAARRGSPSRAAWPT